MLFLMIFVELLVFLVNVIRFCSFVIEKGVFLMWILLYISFLEVFILIGVGGV